MTITDAHTVAQSSDDPFSAEILENPLPFQERLREAGSVVRLQRYGVYAMGRYDTVRSALLDWQDFQSAAGVGMTDFTREKPWRPPSLLLEADPPHHDAPREVLAKILSPRSIRELEPVWADDAERLVDQLIEGPL
ncbi:MAG: cytochrome P450, partial [Leifsonia flava]